MTPFFSYPFQTAWPLFSYPRRRPITLFHPRRQVPHPHPRRSGVHYRTTAHLPDPAPAAPPLAERKRRRGAAAHAAKAPRGPLERGPSPRRLVACGGTGGGAARGRARPGSNCPRKKRLRPECPRARTCRRPAAVVLFSPLRFPARVLPAGRSHRLARAPFKRVTPRAPTALPRAIASPCRPPARHETSKPCKPPRPCRRLPIRRHPAAWPAPPPGMRTRPCWPRACLARRAHSGPHPHQPPPFAPTPPPAAR
jgi:hypothetical protein